MNTENSFQLLLDLDNARDLPTLSVEEHSRVQSLQSSFLCAFNNASLLDEQRLTTTIDTHDRISIIKSWADIESDDVLKLITVFRQVNEFEALCNDDRFTLVKYNLYSLFMLRKCLIFDPVNGSFLDTSEEDLNKRYRFLALCPGSDQIKAEFMRWIALVSQKTEQDGTLLQLLIIVLLFSKGMSMAVDEPPLLDPAAVHRAQTHYIHLIWSYIISKRGYDRAIQQFIQLFNQILRLQMMTKSFRSFLNAQISKPDLIEHIAPLIKTVLHISASK